MQWKSLYAVFLDKLSYIFDIRVDIVCKDKREINGRPGS
jgi:hypothetical protein